MADGVLPGFPSLRNMSVTQPRAISNIMAQQPTTTPEDMQGIQDAMAMQSLRTAALRQAQQQPQSRAAIMQKYFGTPTPLPAQKATAPTQAPSGLGAAIGGFLPEPGSAGMAGLGAAGRALLQLGGYQERPMTLGQMLGQAGDVGMRAFSEAQAAEQAAERQARLDELSRRNIESQIAERQRQKEPKITTRTLPSGEKQDYVFDPENPKADQYGLAVYGKPYSDIKSVAPTAKMQEAMAIYGTLESPEAKAFLREIVGGSTKGQYQAKGTVVDSKGVELGAAVFDTSTGQTLLSVPGADGEELIPMPRGSNVVSVGQESKVIMNVNSLNQLEEQIDLSVMSMEGLTSYLESIEKAPQGLNRLYSDFVADTKTLFSDLVNADVDGTKFTDLTEKELNIALARGKLQSLIGQFRLETVGGGVMTEQDAIRILWSLGGDVNALQNRAVVKDAMTRMFKKKYKNLSRQIKQYNAQVSNPVYMNMYDAIEMPEFDESLLSQKVVKDSERTVFKKGSGKEDVVEQPAVDINIAPEGFDQADWSYLPEADKKAYLGIGN